MDRDIQNPNRRSGETPGIEAPGPIDRMLDRDRDDKADILEGGADRTNTRATSGHRIDKTYQEARGGFEQDFNTRRTAAADDWGRNRTFEQAEPHYRAGYSAAHDERYAGREFEDVEADLRRDYEMNVVNQNYRTVGNRGGMETAGETTAGETRQSGATASGTRAGAGGTTMPADYAGDSDAVIGGGTAGPRGTAMSGEPARSGCTGDVGDTMRNGGDAWEQLREEIRQGWNRARNR